MNGSRLIESENRTKKEQSANHRRKISALLVGSSNYFLLWLDRRKTKRYKWSVYLFYPFLCFYLFLCPVRQAEACRKHPNFKSTRPGETLSGMIPAMAERLNHRRIGLRLP
ncbi:hypothetical protein BDV40DRAFT_267769 [Aspergillus tamarii]|uniref:Uncharacterized protein n=1 Tax=Aspergillus tamarii TaxID=41984 RepID=A0A5N6USJ5_ASPTM|nr:hypothetical protein BDV40DRAFT_267769 [Aspergillus tamarii]